MTAPLTIDQWRRLDKQSRRNAWRAWDSLQRLEMYGLFAATTPGFALPYPDDYNDPADSPTAFRALAIATDDALLTHQHVPSDSGISAATWEAGNLAAGQEKSQTFTKPSGAGVAVSVQHPSTWIMTSSDATDLVTVNIHARNTSSQTINGVRIYYMFIPAA